MLCAVRRLDLDLKDKFGETARDKVAVLMPTNPNNAAHFRHMSKMLRRGQELRNPSADEAGNEGDAAGGGGESKAGGSPETYLFQCGEGNVKEMMHSTWL